MDTGAEHTTDFWCGLLNHHQLSLHFYPVTHQITTAAPATYIYLVLYMSEINSEQN